MTAPTDTHRAPRSATDAENRSPALHVRPRDRTAGAQRVVPPPEFRHDRLAVVAPDAVPAGALVVGVVIVTQDRSPADPVPGGLLPTEPVDLEAPWGDIVTIAGGSGTAGLVVDRRARRVIRDGEDLLLTRREYDLLSHLVTHGGRVHTREHLLQAVWRFENARCGPPRTVDVHVARLRRKLGPAYASGLETLRGVGYRWTLRAEDPADG